MKKRAPSRKTSQTKTPRRAAVPAAPPEGARERIMQVATKLFSENGLNGVSVRDISREASVNLSLVSYYFGGKDGLYNAILEEHVMAFSKVMTQTLSTALETKMTRELFAQTLRKILANIISKRIETPEFTILMRRERLNGLPFARKFYEESMAPLADMMMSFFEMAQKQGILREELNIRSYFITMIESIFGFFEFHDCHLKIWKDAYRLPKEREAYLDFLVRLYTEGVFK